MREADAATAAGSTSTSTAVLSFVTGGLCVLVFQALPSPKHWSWLTLPSPDDASSDVTMTLLAAEQVVRAWAEMFSASSIFFVTACSRAWSQFYAGYSQYARLLLLVFQTASWLIVVAAIKGIFQSRAVSSMRGGERVRALLQSPMLGLVIATALIATSQLLLLLLPSALPPPLAAPATPALELLTAVPKALGIRLPMGLRLPMGIRIPLDIPPHPDGARPPLTTPVGARRAHATQQRLLLTLALQAGLPFLLRPRVVMPLVVIGVSLWGGLGSRLWGGLGTILWRSSAAPPGETPASALMAQEAARATGTTGTTSARHGARQAALDTACATRGMPTLFVPVVQAAFLLPFLLPICFELLRLWWVENGWDGSDSAASSEDAASVPADAGIAPAQFALFALCAFLTAERLLGTALLLVRSVFDGTFYSPSAVARDALRNRSSRPACEPDRASMEHEYERRRQRRHEAAALAVQRSAAIAAGALRVRSRRERGVWRRLLAWSCEWSGAVNGQRLPWCPLPRRRIVQWWGRARRLPLALWEFGYDVLDASRWLVLSPPTDLFWWATAFEAFHSGAWRELLLPAAIVALEKLVAMPLHGPWLPPASAARRRLERWVRPREL